MADWEQCFAHSLPDKDCSQWQTLQAHADGVRQLCEQFAAAFGSMEAASLIGTVHDAGKVHPDFQAHLRGEPQNHPHAADGAKWLDTTFPPSAASWPTQLMVTTPDSQMVWVTTPR